MLHQAKHNWSCPNITVTFATSLVDATEVEVNLTCTIGHKTRVNWRAVDSDSDVHWLPPRFNQNRETKVFIKDCLVPHFTQPCRQAGFNLTNTGWEKQQWCIVLRCQKGRTCECHPNPKAPQNQPGADWPSPQKLNQNFKSKLPK